MHVSRLLLAVALCSCVALIANDAFALELADCELRGSQGVSQVQARCGKLSRPENPNEPDGRQIELRVAVIAALSPEPEPDAFTVINGGPGGSSIELYADSAAAFSGIHRARDIVMVDQRGTGASAALECDELASLTGPADTEQLLESTINCLAGLPGNPRYYTTSVAVQDLDAVRAALGYPQLTLYGVSYGTRVALHYLRRFPEQSRALIIDGVVPPGLALGPAAALNAQAVFDRMLEHCSQNVDCAQAFPDLAAKTAALLLRLEETQVAVTVPDPVTGNPRELELTRDHLAVTMRLLSYAPETIALIPLIIEEAYSNDNYQPIASNALRIIDQLGNQISVGMHNAVVCTEDVPFLGEIDWAALEHSYLGRLQVDALLNTCELWPAGVLDTDLRSPVTADIPTLILSGSEDPITPPEYGAEVDQQLPNSLHIIAPGQGHGVFNRGCIPQLITDFVEQADWHELDISCVQRLGSQPFFIDSLGPAP